MGREQPAESAHPRTSRAPGRRRGRCGTPRDHSLRSMSRESDLKELTAQAGGAFRSGQHFFVAKLKLSAWGPPGHGELPAWGESLEAVEAAGWVLDRWTVAADAGGGMAAYPVFRRSDGLGTQPRDRA